MPDAPFWDVSDILRELVQVQERTRVLMLFANTRGLELPPDVEDRLARLGASALEELIDQIWIDPEAAAQALLTAVGQKGH